MNKNKQPVDKIKQRIIDGITNAVKRAVDEYNHDRKMARRDELPFKPEKLNKG